jgi:hypothetical protein
MFLDRIQHVGGVVDAALGLVRHVVGRGAVVPPGFAVCRLQAGQRLAGGPHAFDEHELLEQLVGLLFVQRLGVQLFEKGLQGHPELGKRIAHALNPRSQG